MILKNDFPIAKTQTFKLNNEPEEIVKKILSSLDFNISFSSIDIDRKLKPKERYKRMHRDIKDAIKRKTNIKTIPKYSILKVGYKCYFFFISEDKVTDIEFLALLLNNDVDFTGLITSILDLSFKNKVINNLEKNYELPTSVLNEKMYLGCIPQKEKTNKFGEIYLDTFEPQFYFCDKTKRFSFSLKSKTFVSTIEGDTIITDNENSAWFKTNIGNLRTTDKRVSSVTSNNTKFMLYKDDYKKTKNYFQNLTYSYLKEMFLELKLEIEPVFFHAQGYESNFLNFDINLDDKLVIFDSYDYKKDEIEHKEGFLNSFSLLNSDIEIKNSDEYNSEVMSNDASYLFVNNLLKGDSSTIKDIIKEKSYSSFLHAYSVQGKNHEDFDLYTKVKRMNFKKNNKFITQGLNVEKIKPKKIKVNNEESLEYININKLKKLKTEIWLKQQIFRGKKISDVELNDSELILFYSKVIQNGKGKSRFIVALNISIKDKTLNIGEHKVYDDVKKFNFDFRKNYISKIDITKYSDSFYIYDKKNEILINSYSSISVPQIIGSERIDSLEYFNENERMTRANDYLTTILPYYISKVIEKGKRMYVYIQNNETDLYYFVSQQQSAPSSLDKQRKVYCIKAFNGEGKEVNAMKQQVVSTFLASFTFNLLNINESSKSSLLEKITKEFLLN